MSGAGEGLSARAAAGTGPGQRQGQRYQHQHHHPLNALQHHQQPRAHAGTVGAYTVLARGEGVANGVGPVLKSSQISSALDASSLHGVAGAGGRKRAAGGGSNSSTVPLGSAPYSVQGPSIQAMSAQWWTGGAISGSPSNRNPASRRSSKSGGRSSSSSASRRGHRRDHSGGNVKWSSGRSDISDGSQSSGGGDGHSRYSV